MKESSTEKNVVNPKPPCDGYNSYDKLLAAAREGLKSAHECLGKVCLKQIVPSLKRHRVSDDEAQDAAVIALSNFIIKIKENPAANIGLLWLMATRKLIDMIRQRKNDIDTPLIEELLEELPADGVDEERVYYYMELLKKSYLTEKEKIVFILFYEQNLSIAEIVKETRYSQSEVYRLKESIDKVKKKKFREDLSEGEI